MLGRCPNQSVRALGGEGGEGGDDRHQLLCAPLPVALRNSRVWSVWGGNVSTYTRRASLPGESAGQQVKVVLNLLTLCFSFSRALRYSFCALSPSRRAPQPPSARRHPSCCARLRTLQRRRRTTTNRRVIGGASVVLSVCWRKETLSLLLLYEMSRRGATLGATPKAVWPTTNCRDSFFSFSSE